MTTENTPVATIVGTLVGQKEFPGGGRFVITVYDLLAMPVDAIINAANGGLAHGGGVAAAIARAAGPAFDEACDRYVAQHGYIPTGQAAVTSAGQLPFKGIIHAIGPRLGEGNEEAKLVGALQHAFRLAQDRGWASLAFPAVSSGIFSVPLETCVRAYLRAVREFFAEFPNSSVRLIYLAVYDGPIVEMMKKSL